MTLERLLSEDAAARRAALEPGVSCIVRAPAGSGKTELLIRRYLALLATVDEPEEVVAITFTRKAAAEMRARVVGSLEAAAGTAPDAEHERVTWELSRRAAARDAERGWRLKEHPARMRIQTIDSLNAELTRQMPVLARFGAQPRVAERPEALYAEAARRTLRLLEDGDADQARAVVELARHLDNDLPRIHRLLTEMLPRRDQWLRHLHGGALPDRSELAAGLTREVQAHLRHVRNALPADCRAELVEVASRAGTILHSQGTTSPIAACAGLKALPQADAAGLPAWRGIAALLLTQDGRWRRKLDKNQGLPPEEAALKVRGMELLRRFESDGNLRALLADVSALPPAEYPDAQWRALAALLTLLPLAVAELRLGFAEGGEVDFVEIALSALQALGEPEAPTDLALALDHRIRHLLVDEFQDTSVNQFRLLEMLTTGWQPDDGRSLFLVGDPAQSIYRFREAEVGLFLRAWEQGLGGLALKPLTLHANFRSHSGLVDWYNASFPRIFPAQADVDSGAVTYAPSAARRAGGGMAVQLHPLFDASREQEAELVCRLIAAAQAEDPRARVAVLVRAKSHLAASVRRLRGMGIHFQAVEVENLADQPVVQDLMALTRALSHAGDRTAWLAVLRAPWCGLSLHELHALAGPEDTVVPARLKTERGPTDPRYVRSREVLLKALEDRGRGSLRAQVESTWLQLGGPAALAGGEALADAEAYLELLEELDEGGALASVGELTERLAQLFARADPEADGSLQLMTIHKAKGLEFDVVILPGLHAVTRGGQKELLLWLERPRAQGVDLLLSPLNATGSDEDPVYEWIQGLQGEQERLEAARLLYVAATRARERLHLIGGVRVVEQEGKTSPGTPRSATLLGLLWPVVEGEFVAALHKYTPTVETARDTPAGPAQFTRLKSAWALPAPAQAVAWARSAVLAGSEEQREFEWVGETLRHVGTVVHRLLQRMAADGARGWDAARIRASAPALRQMLADAGVREQELEGALADVMRAAENTLGDERGRWLLSDAHAEARSEYALSVIREGRLETGVMDRSFVDAEGVRWIVDYKTSRHSGADVDAFLEREWQRYAEQLEGYAELMGGVESRRVKVALYFPLLKRFVSWEPRHGRES